MPAERQHKILPVFEGGDTVMLTWSADIAPEGAPHVAIFDVNSVVVSSVTSVQSDTTHYYAPFPTSRTSAYYVAEWKASKVFNAVSYDSIRRMGFKVQVTEPQN